MELRQMEVEKLSVGDVTEILQPQYIINTGGKSKEGCSIITFPDRMNFHFITDDEYERLILYLTSVASIQEADLGFHVIIDRRKDRWSSVKTVLLNISRYFPGLVHVVYVIRPENIFQKALAELSNVLSTEKFKFRLIILSSVIELTEYVDATQLTSELGGTLQYSHHDWIQQRIALEEFSQMTKMVSNLLNHFTHQISQTEEFPNSVDSTHLLLDQQQHTYSELKDEILKASKHGEILLQNIKVGVQLHDSENALVVARLLIQLQETECTFDSFWHEYSGRLRQCLELRRFEQEFRELQSNFDSHLKNISEMTEVGETVNRVDTLVHETNTFEKLCVVDIERAEEVVALGDHLLKNQQYICPAECIQPKCAELARVSAVLSDRLRKRINFLLKCRELMERIEKANDWCTKGVDLLASQQIEKCSQSPELAEQSLLETQRFVASVSEFRGTFEASITAETKALVIQVVQRIDDISLMCEKRIENLQKLSVKPLRPVQCVSPKPALPLQPPGGAPNLKKNIITMIPSATSAVTVSEQDEESKTKQRQVLMELLETERVYVSELNSILFGYKKEMELDENQSVLPQGLPGKVDILFGNLEEIYSFHNEMFLKDLENCFTSSDLVALCFIQKREMFYRLYSYYCQNIKKSEQVRESLVDSEMFLYACQMKLGHKLPLAAYLLKPVQRITKYQLLLKDLARYSLNNSNTSVHQALDCMLVVLKLVNDSMHQYTITGFPGEAELVRPGDLLLHGSFSIWAENRKDLRLRLKPMQRHIFLFPKVLLLCKRTSAGNVDSDTDTECTNYHYKQHLKMSQIGLTESVKGDGRKFEIWSPGRHQVYTIHASTTEQKQTWVNEIKKVLFNQLEELKGEQIKQYTHIQHKSLRQTSSWEKQPQQQQTLNTSVSVEDDTFENHIWSSDCSNSDDEEFVNNKTQNGHYIALADYNAAGNSEVSFQEGDILELWKVGCAGWWFVKLIGGSSNGEGWAPAAYLEPIHKKSLRSTSSKKSLDGQE